MARASTTQHHGRLSNCGFKPYSSKTAPKIQTQNSPSKARVCRKDHDVELTGNKIFGVQHKEIPRKLKRTGLYNPNGKGSTVESGSRANSTKRYRQSIFNP
jgi:hypothetical protein